MAIFESIEAWETDETAHIDKVVHGLYVIRDEELIGTSPVAAFVLGGNRAINDSVDAVFAHYLGRIAYDTGLLDDLRPYAYDQEEVSMIVLSLSQLGKILKDPRNPAKYFHSTFQPL